MINGILWRVEKGAKWDEVLERYGPGKSRLSLTDTFSEIVTWSWRRHPGAAAGVLAGLVADLQDRVSVAGSLIDAVLGGLVLHPVGDGESRRIKVDLRPRVVAALGRDV